MGEPLQTYSTAQLVAALDHIVGGLVGVVFLIGSVLIGLAALSGAARRSTGSDS